MKEVVRYNEAFKMTIVEKVGRGMYTSISEAHQHEPPELLQKSVTLTVPPSQ